MRNTLVGIAAFGNFPFTKLAVESVFETSDACDVFLVIGKNTDVETIDYAEQNGLSYVVHEYNKGFPYSINDMYDFAWKENDYENLIVMGNDTIVYPYAIASMIEISDAGYEWVCAKQVDVRDLCITYPECNQYFAEHSFSPLSLDHRCWEKFDQHSEEVDIQPVPMGDVHNFTLYKKSVMEKLGYIDVNFYPAYYSDNDYCRRAVNSGDIKSCTSGNSWYFHFWSRTIHEQQIDTNKHHGYFRKNREFYLAKWGGDFGQEAYTLPFNDNSAALGNEVVLYPTLNIETRDDEEKIIAFWRLVGGE